MNYAEQNLDSLYCDATDKNEEFTVTKTSDVMLKMHDYEKVLALKDLGATIAQMGTEAIAVKALAASLYSDTYYSALNHPGDADGNLLGDVERQHFIDFNDSYDNDFTIYYDFERGWCSVQDLLDTKKFPVQPKIDGLDFEKCLELTGLLDYVRGISKIA